MESHQVHSHTKEKHFKHYLFEFFMLFFAVTLGFFVENIREHYTEKERLHTYLKSMLLDIKSNVSALDSVVCENKKMILTYDVLAKDLLNNEATINRKDFAQKMGAIWYRGFINRNETFEQMKSSGSLRYITNLKFLNDLMQYVRATNFAQYRTEHFEQKYYTDIFLPTIYKNYDMPCMIFLDSAYSNNPSFIIQAINHIDILSGNEAQKFRQDVGGALMLRLERLRVTITAYKKAKENCISLEQLIKKEIE